MVSVPVLGPTALDATLKLTVPLPLPLAPDAIVIHVALLVAVHAQPPAVETATGVPAPPAIGKDWLLGLMEVEQFADCVTVNVCPAMVSVPVRAAPVLAAMAKLTVPLPVPLAPDVIVIHAALLAAVQAHPVVVETATGVPAPPAIPMD
jgi:hypothetical protein